MDDESLVRQARTGDLSALDTLARRWQVPLVRFLERRVGRHADAEDLFQEAFVRVCQHLDDFDDRRSFKTWIFTIAWRLAANHLRDRRRHANSDALEHAKRWRGVTGEELAGTELRENLWSLAKRVLRDDQYIVLWLFYVEGFLLREIASMTGKSWIAQKLHRTAPGRQPHVETV